MDRRAFLGCLPAICVLPAVAKADQDEFAVKFKGPGNGLAGIHISGDPIAIQYIICIDEYGSGTPSTFSERYMRPFEECLEIAEQNADSFRRAMMAYIGHLFLRNGSVDLRDSPQLVEACKMIREHKLGEVRDGEIVLFSPPEHLFS